MSRKLTDKEMAVIKTIFVHPDYRFKYNELDRAKRMAKKGILYMKKPGIFIVTGKGRKYYRKELS